MTDHLTQVTGSVIKNNTVTEVHLANSSVDTRQLVDGSVTNDKLSTAITDFQANDYNTYLSALANDYNTYLSALANDEITYTTLNSALVDLIDGSTEFTAVSKIFQGNIIVRGDLTVQGASFTANVATLEVEDKNIAVNFNGTNATAEGAGISVEGDSAYYLANLEYASASTSLFRIGTGVLDTSDDVARTQDYQANDYITYNQAQANINALSSNTLPLIGGTLTGDLILAGDPDAALKAATKQYVDSIGGGANAIPVSNTNTSTSTSNVFFLGINNTTSEAHIFVWTDGVYQSEDFWVYNSGNNTIQLDEASMPAGIEIATRAFTEIA